MTMGSVRMVWQEAAGACVIKAGKELPALQVRLTQTHPHVHTEM